MVAVVAVVGVVVCPNVIGDVSPNVGVVAVVASGVVVVCPNVNAGVVAGGGVAFCPNVNVGVAGVFVCPSVKVNGVVVVADVVFDCPNANGEDVCPSTGVVDGVGVVDVGGCFCSCCFSCCFCCCCLSPSFFLSGKSSRTICLSPAVLSNH